jgi:CcmD family protein
MDSMGFTLAAYVVTFILIGGYTWSLRRRLQRARRGVARPPE